jgi:enterobacterial common antigen flippase
MTAPTGEPEKSYDRILYASSITGGAQLVGLLLGVIRIKVAAVIIGPLGIGLLGNYQALQTAVGTLTGLGLQSSGVRDVARSAEAGDMEKVVRTAIALRRLCWFTGMVGATVMVALSRPLSMLTFGSHEYAADIALLAVAVLLASLAGGQMALIQGLRRIGDLGRVSIIGAFAGTLIAVAFYGLLGLDGIIPALLLMALAQLAASWWYARRIELPTLAVSWIESLRDASGMVQLGVAFMWSALAMAVADYVIRVLITQQISIEAVGIFSAAFALSGLLLNFILGAMSADYFPRLSSAAEDPALMRRLINEQIEIGLLLALPAVLATLSLAPWVIRLLYTEDFLAAVPLLQWFALGCVGRIIGWPIGFTVLALGKGSWFIGTQTLFHTVHLGLVFIGLLTFGLEGVAMAFPLQVVFGIAVVHAIARRLIGFRWSSDVLRLLAALLPTALGVFLITRTLDVGPATAVTLPITALVCGYCLRSLVARVGREHRLIQVACKLPGIRWVCGI